MLRNKRIFITGGAGFIGSTLIGRLIDSNIITAYDNLRRDSLTHRQFAEHPNLTLVKGDVMNYPAMHNAMKDAQIVIHCAAIAGIDTVIKSPTETIRTNLVGTSKTLEAAATLTGLERFVNFSTSEVFGVSSFRSEENDAASIGAVGEARWTYSVSKLAGEHLTKAYHQEFDMPTVTIRPFNIYGPGQVGEGALSIFIQKAMKNEPIQIHGDGNQIRAWCYIDDFVDGVYRSITNPNAIGESFNIGNARAVLTIFGLAQTVVRVLGSMSTIEFVPKSGPDVELRVPSVEKARQLVGFESKVDLEEGIRRTAESYEANAVRTVSTTHRWQTAITTTDEENSLINHDTIGARA